MPVQFTLSIAMICVLVHEWHCRQDALKRCMPGCFITDTHMDEQIDGRAGRQTHRQTDRQADGRQAGKQTALLKRDMDDAIS